MPTRPTPCRRKRLDSGHYQVIQSSNNSIVLTVPDRVGTFRLATASIPLRWMNRCVSPHQSGIITFAFDCVWFSNGAVWYPTSGFQAFPKDVQTRSPALSRPRACGRFFVTRAPSPTRRASPRGCTGSFKNHPPTSAPSGFHRAVWIPYNPSGIQVPVSGKNTKTIFPARWASLQPKPF